MLKEFFLIFFETSQIFSVLFNIFILFIWKLLYIFWVNFCLFFSCFLENIFNCCRNCFLFLIFFVQNFCEKTKVGKQFFYYLGTTFMCYCNSRHSDFFENYFIVFGRHFYLFANFYLFIFLFLNYYFVYVPNF